MSYPVYMVPAGDVLPVMFDTFDGGTGASITMSGLAVTDVEIYKDGSVTQRSSDAGYTLLDTDGIDFDGVTGIHGFSIDTGDNTDAGFYTVGAWFHVVVSAITVDAQTVSFIACAFRLMAAESVAGKPKVDVDAWLGTAAATPTTAGVPEVDVTHWLGTAAATPTVAGVPEVDITHFGGSAGTFASGVPAVNSTQISGDATAADNLETAFDDTAGPVPWLGIVDQGTAVSATATTLVGRAAGAFANDTIIGATLAVLGSTQGYWQLRTITDVDLATDTFTVDAWTVTPSGTITYKIWGSAPASTSLPIAVNVTQIGGSAVTSVSGRPEVNVAQWSGQAVATPSVAGVPEVDVTHWIGTAAATPTTAGVPEVDLTHIAGAAVSTTTAQLGVNVEKINNVDVVGAGTSGDKWRA